MNQAPTSVHIAALLGAFALVVGTAGSPTIKAQSVDLDVAPDQAVTTADDMGTPAG